MRKGAEGCATRSLGRPDGDWRDVPGRCEAPRPASSVPALRCASELGKGYFVAHSQKFHQTPVEVGLYFTPVTLSLYASTPTDWNSGRP